MSDQRVCLRASITGGIFVVTGFAVNEYSGALMMSGTGAFTVMGGASVP
jgi:hypothetical protein